MEEHSDGLLIASHAFVVDEPLPPAATEEQRQRALKGGCARLDHEQLGELVAALRAEATKPNPPFHSLSTMRSDVALFQIDFDLTTAEPSFLDVLQGPAQLMLHVVQRLWRDRAIEAYIATASGWDRGGQAKTSCTINFTRTRHRFFVHKAAIAEIRAVFKRAHAEEAAWDQVFDDAIYCRTGSARVLYCDKPSDADRRKPRGRPLRPLAIIGADGQRRTIDDIAHFERTMLNRLSEDEQQCDAPTHARLLHEAQRPPDLSHTQQNGLGRVPRETVATVWSAIDASIRGDEGRATWAKLAPAPAIRQSSTRGTLVQLKTGDVALLVELDSTECLLKASHLRSKTATHKQPSARIQLNLTTLRVAYKCKVWHSACAAHFQTHPSDFSVPLHPSEALLQLLTALALPAGAAAELDCRSCPELRRLVQQLVGASHPWGAAVVGHRACSTGAPAAAPRV